MALTKAERKAYFEEHGFYPIEDSDIPDDEKIVLTEEQIEESLKAVKRQEALEYLNSTDWYAARKAETGKEIPTDIKQKRAQARIDAEDGA